MVLKEFVRDFVNMSPSSLLSSEMALKEKLVAIPFSRINRRRHDIQHNDIHHYDTRHIWQNCYTKISIFIVAIGVFILNVVLLNGIMPFCTVSRIF